LAEFGLKFYSYRGAIGDSKMAGLPVVAIVTGASRGAGRGIARALGSHGCIVYVTGRSEVDGDGEVAGTIHATASEVDAAGGKGIAVRCDHADDTQVQALVERVIAEQGRVDILVNNACAISDASSAPGQFWEKPLYIGNMIDVGRAQRVCRPAGMSRRT
jgi:NAD(P)-dependent dehydrogenase (short-subunit alcohol dehydrogenase family)